MHETGAEQERKKQTTTDKRGQEVRRSHHCLRLLEAEMAAVPVDERVLHIM